VFLAGADAPDQIAQVIRALVTDPAFAAPPQKMRRPFEFLAALYRATGVTVGGTENSMHWQLSRAGWQQHTFPPPTGHPDRAQDWQAGTVLLRLVDYALYAHDDWFDGTASRLSDHLPAGIATMGELAAHWTQAAHGNPDDRMLIALAAMGSGPDDPIPDDPDARHDLSAVVLAFAALSPRFLYR
jgi:uncharacterized protein (DUF1800 family)